MPGSWLRAVAAGAACSLVALWTWGSFNEPPALNDERAYHAQARIFASGQWTAPSPPQPEFFHQLYMFTEPAIASKYWPGHSLTLVPGIWLGLPGLVPIALTGLTGAILFAIVSRLYGAPAAILTVFLWGVSTYSLRYRVSFLSHATSGAAWMIACWALLAWREMVSRRSPAVVIALALAWIACTRPLTAVALALPILFIVFRGLRTGAARRNALLATAAAAVVLTLIPIWSVATLGTWRTTPYAEYARLYFPFDRLGVGFDATPPARELTPDMERYAVSLGEYFRGHTWGALPRIAAERVWQAAGQLSLFWPLPLWLFLCVSLVVRLRTDPPFRFACFSMLSVFAVHLFFPHPHWWTAYYSEVFPVFFLGAALGVVDVMRWMGLEHTRARGRVAFAVLLVSLAPFAAHSIETAGAARRFWGGQLRAAEAAFVRIPESRAIVFVRHGEDHDMASGIVAADPFWSEAPRWVVHDLGARNEALISAAPDRAAYLYRCPSGELTRLSGVRTSAGRTP